MSVDPFDVRYLDVGNGHELYVEQVGNPEGVPVVYLHGGPGSGATEYARTWFDPEVHRAVLFDQRAAGRSRPHASEPAVDWSAIDMAHHLRDIERIRSILGIERWIVFGISWGSVLGMAYAELHRERVSGIVLAAVSAGTRAEIDWLVEGVGAHYPDEWRRLRDHVPAELRHMRLIDAYRALVMNPDPNVHDPAAAAWCRWEDAHLGVNPDLAPSPRFADPPFRLGFARQVTHCWSADSWLLPDQLISGVDVLSDTPAVLIHGTSDISTPSAAAEAMHSAWPASQLVLTEDGHGGPDMRQAWTSALRTFAERRT